MFRFLPILAAVALTPAFAQKPDACFTAAAAKYNLDPHLLWSIAMVESSGRADAVNLTHQNRTNSVDLGIMQINSSHLPTLARYGITREKLMNDRCLNIEVGAWILADVIKRLGPTWNAVGAYNTACVQLKGRDCEESRTRYTTKVWKWYASARATPVAQASPPRPASQSKRPTITIVEEESN